MSLKMAVQQFREAILLGLPRKEKVERIAKVFELYDGPEPWHVWRKRELEGPQEEGKADDTTLRKYLGSIEHPEKYENELGKRRRGRPRKPMSPEQQYIMQRAVVNVIGMAEGFGRYMTASQRRSYYDTLRNRFECMVEAVDRRPQGGNGSDTVESNHPNDADTH